MMYFLDRSGNAPTGSLPNEDQIAFNPSALQVQQVGDRWKVVEGTHWLLDFGVGEANARAALHFIRKHRFNRMCFVARPHPPMTYFKRVTGVGRELREIDERMLDLSIEAAAWRVDHAALLARHSPSVDFSRPRTAEDASHHRIKVAVSDGEGHRSAPHIICRHGITGLDCGREAVVELAESAAVLDLEIAHFGEAPEVKVFGADDRVIAELTMDPRPRQIERLRVVDKSIRKAIVRAKGGSVLLVSASTPPAELLLKD